MVYKLESRLKCIQCGFGLFLEQKKQPTMDCPRCKAKYSVSEEDGELSLESL